MKTKKKPKRKQLTQRKKKKLIKTVITTVAAIPPPTPDPMAINTNAPTDTLITAYPITLQWDNDEDCYMIELSAFNQELHATTDWNQSLNFAKLIQRLLIETYRANNLNLPEVG